MVGKRKTRIGSVLAFFVLMGFIYVRLFGIYPSAHKTVSKLIPPKFVTIESKQKSTLSGQQCLDCLTHGEWIPRENVELKSEEILFKKVITDVIWAGHQIPPTLQRTDTKCGNVAYVSPYSGIFRALCNPEGKTPCCFENMCVNKTITDCTCKNCYDMRSRIVAEFATWKTSSEECSMEEMFTHRKACNILKQKNITLLLVLGDSLARHIYVSMLIHLNNDPVYGAIDPKSTTEIKQRCKGYAQYSEKECRSRIPTKTTVCDGEVEASFAETYKVDMATQAVEAIHALGSNNSSMVISSVGLHNGFNSDYMIKEFISKTVATTKLLQNASKSYLMPHYLWITPHVPGLLKGPGFTTQSKGRSIEYAERVTQYLHAQGVNVLNTHNITDTAFSWDGTHFGSGVNQLISQIVFSYIENLDLIRVNTPK